MKYNGTGIIETLKLVKTSTSPIVAEELQKVMETEYRFASPKTRRKVARLVQQVKAKHAAKVAAKKQARK